MSTGLKFSSYSNYLSFNPAVIINFFYEEANWDLSVASRTNYLTSITA